MREIIRQELGADAKSVAKPPSAVAVACGKCHSGEAVKGNFRIDINGLEAGDVTRAIRALASGAMPPQRQLTREEKNAVLQSLLDLEFEPATALPAEPQQPEEVK